MQSPPDARGVVAVTTHPGAVADALTAEWAGLSLESLQPGALVNARVRRVQGDGLLLTFLTFFHGAFVCFRVRVFACGKYFRRCDGCCDVCSSGHMFACGLQISKSFSGAHRHIGQCCLGVVKRSSNSSPHRHHRPLSPAPPWSLGGKGRRGRDHQRLHRGHEAQGEWCFCVARRKCL